MIKRFAVAAATIALIGIQPAHALGLGGFWGVVIDAGAKLGGAAVDMAVDGVKDALRDPDAEAAKKREEERKVAEAFTKAQQEIDGRKDLTPLQRERLSLSLVKQYQQVQHFQRFVEEAEARQKAERDKLFTTAGLLGLATDAAANVASTRVAMAQADAMVKAGIPQAQARESIAQADAKVAAGIPQRQAKAALEKVDEAMRAGVPQQALVEETSPANRQVTLPEAVATVPAGRGPVTTMPAPGVDAFIPDRGKRLHVEFIGSPSLTAFVRQVLAERGHTLVEQADQAEVAYRIEGEFAVPENKQYDGISMDIGRFLESPQPVKSPEKKLMGSITGGLKKFLLVASVAQGANVPAEAVPRDINEHKQELLLVIARQPLEGAETRVSAVKTASAKEMQATSLAREAMADLFSRVGLPVPPQVALAAAEGWAGAM